MEKICVYTCITGAYDDLKEVKIMEEGIDYLCFTNNKKIKSKTWKIIYIEDKTLDNHYLSRKLKMLGDPYLDKNYTLSIYIDASIIFKKSVKEFLAKYFDLKNDLFAACKHSVRNSIKEEAEACIIKGKDREEIIKKQLAFYQKEKFKDDLGLLEMTLIIKRHRNPLVKKTMELWFKMILEYSKRDQLSFMYCLSKTKLPVKVIPLNVWKNDYIEHTPHNKDKFDGTYQVFYDHGNGFNEEDKDNFKYQQKDNHFILDLKISNDLNKLRLDLTDVLGISFKIVNIKGITKNELEWQDFFLYKDCYISNSIDPKVIINKKLPKGKHLTITFEIEELTKKALFNIINDLTLEKNDLQENLLILENENKKLQLNIETILNSTSYKITKPLRFLKAKIKR